MAFHFLPKSGDKISTVGIGGAKLHLVSDDALAEIGDDLAKQHYLNLEHKAGECIECGSCEENCPFQVPVREKMTEAVTRFGC